MWKHLKNKKGAFTLGDLPTIVMTLVLTAGFFVGGFLALSGLTDGVACPSGYEYNAGSQTCTDISNSSITTELTKAGNASVDVQTGLGNVTSQMPVIGTIIGVAILLGILAVGFSFGRQKGFI